MANVTIRNLADEVIEKLRTRAKAHNRSLEAEIRAALSDAANTLTPEELRARAEKIAALTPADRPQTDSVLLLREDRRR